MDGKPVTERGSEAPKSRHRDIDAIRSFVGETLQKWQIPGAAIAVVAPDLEPITEAFGVRQLGSPAKVTPNTTFGVGSLSKAFTAAALGLLVDEGHLDWDDPVAAHLPYFTLADPYLGRMTTIRDLLAHRVGWQEDYWTHFANRLPLSREELVRSLRFAETGRFRSHYAYSNVLYVAAGQVVEAISGRPWDQFVIERLFEPLGMTSGSTRARDLLAASNHATSHFRTLSGDLVVDPIRPDLWWTADTYGPAASVNLTIRDFIPWIRLWLAKGRHDNRSVLSQSTVEQIFQPCTLTDGRPRPANDIDELGYGLGWLVCRYRRQLLLCHSGAFRGMSAYIGMVPEAGVGVAVLANSRDSVIGDLSTALGQWLLDLHLGLSERNWPEEYRLSLQNEWIRRRKVAAEAGAIRLAGTSPSLPLQSYAGQYRHPAFAPWSVTYEDGRLTIQREPYHATLQHWHLDTFRVMWNDPLTDYWPGEFICFSVDPGGTIASMRLLHNLEPGPDPSVASNPPKWTRFAAG